jgi:hypothetical protein
MAAPTLQNVTLSSNRGNALPAGTLQVICFYDGNDACAFGFEYKDIDGTTGYIWLKGIKQFDTEIRTAQLSLNGSTLTGRFSVSGVRANGVVDGLAFGLFWRDARGGFHILRSNSEAPSTGAAFVGAWPLGGWSADRFMQKVTAGTDGFARETALAVICGAKLLPDGDYVIPVL